MNDKPEPDRPQPVRCASGYTYAQRPVGFTYAGQEYQVRQVIAEWRQPSEKKFIVLTESSVQFELSYEIETHLWRIRLQTGETPAKQGE
ncbi:MAG: hypothetical protein JW757_09985 [Anaerolineales bacterium]|nr:hypothetical protein [Anaerolineales bacterium]